MVNLIRKLKPFNNVILQNINDDNKRTATINSYYPKSYTFSLGKKMQKSEKIRYQRLIHSLYKIQLSAIFPPVHKSLEAKIQDGRHFLGLNRQKIQKNVF